VELITLNIIIMKTLKLNEMETINGGSFLGGMCGGLMIAEGGIGLAAVAVSYGWMAAIPGLNIAAGVVGGAALLTCGAYTIANS